MEPPPFDPGKHLTCETCGGTKEAVTSPHLPGRVVVYCERCYQDRSRRAFTEGLLEPPPRPWRTVSPSAPPA